MSRPGDPPFTGYDPRSGPNTSRFQSREVHYTSSLRDERSEGFPLKDRIMEEAGGDRRSSSPIAFGRCPSLMLHVLEVPIE